MDTPIYLATIYATGIIPGVVMLSMSDNWDDYEQEREV